VWKRRLLVYYLATERDPPPTIFLVDFAKTPQPYDL
jgi:hypothetical protein